MLETFVSTFAQRPLNTTTNLTNVVIEPFFVKPTSITAKQMYVKPRDGGSSFVSNSNGYDSLGIRNKERMLPPSHPNSHLDIFVPPLNVGGGQSDDQSTHHIPPANNRLHKPRPQRVNKFAQIKFMTNNANASWAGGSGFDSIITGKTVSKPEAHVQSGSEKQPSVPDNLLHPESSFKTIKDQIRIQNNQHTPPPPPNNGDDIDTDEKLGIKCSFEKPCAWTFDQNVTGPNFEVTSGLKLKKSNLTGENKQSII